MSEVWSNAFVHPTEDLLEEYCFNRVMEPRLAALEEHLLVCEACQAEVAGLGEYIGLFKSATRELSPGVLKPDRPKQSLHSFVHRLLPAAPPEARTGSWMNFPRIPHLPLYIPRLAGMVSAIALVVLLAFGVRREFTASTDQPVRVELAAMRGGPATSMQSVPFSSRGQLAKAFARKPLDLVIDRIRLTGTQGHLVKLVDSEGNEVWSGPASVQGNWLSAQIKKGLSRGIYWARLYSDRGQLISEYGLEID